MNRLKQIWLSLTSGLWFLPLAMVTISTVLAIALPTVDSTVGAKWAQTAGMFFGVGTDGARGMLTAIASSMMTVASLTFSLTVITLATASAQYTSRLVRNFMRDRVNQFVLGYFVSLYAYCLIVLRTIRGGDGEPFVPHIAVLVGLVMALASIAVLIFFIHHISDSIQASTICDKVTDETLQSVARLFPDEVGEPATQTDPEPERKAVEKAIPNLPYRRELEAGTYGFVKSLDTKKLLEISQKLDIMIHMELGIGSFVTPHATLARIDSRAEIEDETLDRVREVYSIGSARTIEQDAAFGVRQLVDMAIKALSPGVNDTTTAVMCAQHIGVVMEKLAQRDIPEKLRAADGVVRISATGQSFDSLVSLSLDQIRQNAAGNPVVLSTLLENIERTARQTCAWQRRQTLARHALLLKSAAEETIPTPADREPVVAYADRVLAQLSADQPDS